MDKRWWLWMGVFIATGNAVLAVVALIQRDLFLFLLSVCVTIYVGKPLWDIRAKFKKAD